MVVMAEADTSVPILLAVGTATGGTAERHFRSSRDYEVVRGGVEPPTFRSQVNTCERCADLFFPGR
jgi:hypothetical protein